MHTFIVLGTYTDEGRRNISSSPERLDTAKSVFARVGGTVKEFYLTMGEYDFIAVLEAADDALVAKFVLAVASGGNIKPLTLRAFPEAEYRKIIKGAAN